MSVIYIEKEYPELYKKLCIISKNNTSKRKEEDYSTYFQPIKQGLITCSSSDNKATSKKITNISLNLPTLIKDSLKLGINFTSDISEVEIIICSVEIAYSLYKNSKIPFEENDYSVIIALYHLNKENKYISFEDILKYVNNSTKITINKLKQILLKLENIHTIKRISENTLEWKLMEEIRIK